ncbi:MAG: hypothetical protein P4L79_11110 [Legionella sp.]|uniref:hypothetical protein n=1 Tax=Legionella sp. TaxID=459 RepID=UPI00284D7440|nr:hypothetical protein [Legionella sp.]
MEHDDIDPIAKALNILPTITVDQPKNEVTVYSGDPAQQDFDKARLNYHDLIGTGQTALGDLLVVAKQSQNPRAYEVLFNALKMLGEMNTSMIDLHTKNQENHPEQDMSNAKITNNNLFVGSTAELQKMLTNIKKGTAMEDMDTNDREE